MICATECRSCGNEPTCGLDVWNRKLLIGIGKCIENKWFDLVRESKAIILQKKKKEGLGREPIKREITQISTNVPLMRIAT